MNLNHIKHLVLIVAVSLISFSCEDDPVSNQEEHFDAIGTIIYDATGAIAVSILRGETVDTLFIENGVLSDHFDVKFYNEDENIIDPPTSEGVTLDYEFEDNSFADWWQHEGEEGGFEFHLRGKKVGITHLELFIKHEGHNDYRSGRIPISVK